MQIKTQSLTFPFEVNRILLQDFSSGAKMRSVYTYHPFTEILNFKVWGGVERANTVVKTFVLHSPTFDQSLILHMVPGVIPDQSQK